MCFFLGGVEFFAFLKAGGELNAIPAFPEILFVLAWTTGGRHIVAPGFKSVLPDFIIFKTKLEKTLSRLYNLETEIRSAICWDIKSSWPVLARRKCLKRPEIFQSIARFLKVIRLKCVPKVEWP